MKIHLEETVRPDVQYQCAAWMAINKFTVWRDLEYADLGDFTHSCRQPAALALARRCIAKATEEADLARIKRRRVAELPCASSGDLKLQQSAHTGHGDHAKEYC